MNANANIVVFLVSICQKNFVLWMRYKLLLHLTAETTETTKTPKTWKRILWTFYALLWLVQFCLWVVSHTMDVKTWIYRVRSIIIEHPYGSHINICWLNWYQIKLKCLNEEHCNVFNKFDSRFQDRWLLNVELFIDTFDLIALFVYCIMAGIGSVVSMYLTLSLFSWITFLLFFFFSTFFFFSFPFQIKLLKIIYFVKRARN